MDAAGADKAVQTTPLKHVGSRGPAWWTSFFLTVQEQKQLATVAWAEEPVRQIANLIQRYDREQNRQTLLSFGALGVYCLVFPALWLKAPAWVSLILFGSTFLVLGLSARLAVRLSRQRNELVIGSLMKVIRQLERPHLHFGEACRLINRAADLFYRSFSRRRGDKGLLKRRPPPRYRALEEADAERGAAAIASQAWRLAGKSPEPDAVADDLRRVVLRVASGNWRQVEHIDISGERPAIWSPPGFSRRVGAALQRDVTLKVLGLITAIIVLVAAVSKLLE
ncbi:hypothetical protein GCM10022204_27060 [Microlunatus aurantiacus]|uniref:Uncharacterized protein n=1 Tax=Microlunatus aurantiacus TaxID=446786 RepID=A0ABP7DPN1_9ACTN